jgi:chromosome partitioning protein
MGKVIAIVNQKGGVGKTTTNVNLAACLAQAGKRVLVADMDPQGNTSSGLGVEKTKLTHTIYNLLMGDANIEQVKISLSIENLDLLPANIHLSGAEIELVNQPQREFLLRGIFNHTRYLYDFVLIDCPPSLNMLTLNALCAADTVLVPIQCEYYALEGLSQLMHTIGLVQRRLNPRLSIEGAVFTMFDARTNLSVQVVDQVKNHFTARIFSTIIPRNVRLSEAPSHGLPITLYDPSSKGAEAYISLAQEIIENEGSRR